MSRLQAKWRASKLSEHSIRTYVAHLSKALAWAKSQGMIPEIPSIERPQLAKKERKAKGRPISLEEFERMLAAIPLIIKEEPNAVASWDRLLRGLWLSGLRLDEALRLSWSSQTDLRVDLDGAFPALIIPSAGEKGRKDRIIPLTGDFAEFLKQTPPRLRKGRVFVLTTQRKIAPTNMQYVSKVISRIGKAAGIIVGKYTANEKTKYASAHDLRRSFGRRWGGLVQNIFDLQTLMRHESVETTRTYYAHEDAAGLAKRLQDLAITFAITPVSPAGSENSKPVEKQGVSCKLPGQDSNLD
jgi:integrase